MKLNPLPVRLSAPQKRKLMMRGAVTLKPAQFSEDGDFTLMVMPNTVRRVATAMKNGKGVRIMLKPGEKMMDNKTGGNLLDDMKDAFSKVSAVIDMVPEPIKEIAVKTATDFIRKKTGLGAHTMGAGYHTMGKGYHTMGAGYHTMGSGAHTMGSGAHTMGSGAHTMVGGRSCCMMSSKGSMMTGKGRNIFENPVDDRIKYVGLGFKPAGGDNYGAGMVQLGSPYLASNSPAQHPFIAKSIQLTGKGFMPAG